MRSELTFGVFLNPFFVLKRDFQRVDLRLIFPFLFHDTLNKRGYAKKYTSMRWINKDYKCQRVFEKCLYWYIS